MPTCGSHSNQTSILRRARNRCCSSSTICERRCTFPINRRKKLRLLPDRDATTRLAFLAAALLNLPQPYSPIKFGLVWNIDKRTWVHWDGNTKSPIARNLLASLGLGAPLHGKHADLQFEMVKRQTDLTEKIRPPAYPFAIDQAAAQRGAPLFASNCNSCHGGPESDKRLYSVAEIRTDPHRAEMFTPKAGGRFQYISG